MRGQGGRGGGGPRAANVHRWRRRNGEIFRRESSFKAKRAPKVDGRLYIPTPDQLPGPSNARDGRELWLYCWKTRGAGKHIRDLGSGMWHTVL